MSLVKDIQSVMYDDELSKDDKRAKKQSFCFGFLDGYFNEMVYVQYINDKYKYYYENGYKNGIEQRKCTNDNSINNSKKVWVIKLACYDYENNIKTRNLTEEYKKTYDLYYSDLENKNSDIEIPYKGNIKI